MTCGRCRHSICWLCRAPVVAGAVHAAGCPHRARIAHDRENSVDGDLTVGQLSASIEQARRGREREVGNGGDGGGAGVLGGTAAALAVAKGVWSRYSWGSYERTEGGQRISNRSARLGPLLNELMDFLWSGVRRWWDCVRSPSAILG